MKSLKLALSRGLPLMMKHYELKIDARSGAAGDMFLAAFFSLFKNLKEEERLDVSLEQIEGKLRGVAAALGSSFEVEILPAKRREVEGIKINLQNRGVKSHSHHVTYVKLLRLIEDFSGQKILEKDEAEQASLILKIIAEAEALAHGVEISKVHFHEVGEEDSVFDIVGAGVLISTLNLLTGGFNVVSSYVEIGKGKIATSHGPLDVPAPATKYILDNHDVFHQVNYEGECLTPTGAAVLAALKPKYLKNYDNHDITRGTQGIGCGSQNPNDRANILRLELIKR